MKKTATRNTRTAAQAYEENARRIEALMPTLKNELFRYICEFTPNTRSSTQPKDLSPVKSLLEEAVSHMHQANEQ